MELRNFLLPTFVLLCFFLCEIKAENCEPDWTYHSSTYSCMKFFRNWWSFNEASNKCAEYNSGHLVYIFDQETDDFVKDLVDRDLNSPIFIGLHDRTTAGQYAWGKNDNKTPTYFNWENGEPDEDNGKRHVIITRYGWAKYVKNSNAYFVCQTNAKYTKPRLSCPIQEIGTQSTNIVCELPNMNPSELVEVTIKSSTTEAIVCDQQSCRASAGYEAPRTLDFSTTPIEVPLTITNVSRFDEGQWICAYKLNGKPDLIEDQCDLKVYTVAEQLDCQWEFTNSNKELQVICTAGKVFPQGNCWWTLSVDNNQMTPPLGRDATNEDRGNYYRTSCSTTISPEPGQNTVSVFISPSVEGFHQRKESSKSVNITIEVPSGSPALFANDHNKEEYRLVDIIEASASQRLSLMCKIPGGTPPVHTTSLQCDTAVKDIDGKSEKSKDEPSVTMDFIVTGDMDGKSCTCTGSHITNRYTKKTSVKFSVKYPPNISSFSINPRELTAGYRVAFDCRASGNPTPKLSLFHIGDQGQRELVHQVEGGDLFYQKAALCNMSGQYVCSAQNTASTVEETRTENLAVRCKPEHCDLKEPTPRFGAIVGQAFTIDICLRANPEPDQIRSLRKGSSSIEKTAVFNYTNKDTFRGKLALTINDLKKEQLGDVQLYIQNSVGYTYLKFNLIPQGPPECPKDLVVSAEYSHVITLQWTPGFNGGLTQTFIISHHDVKTLTSNERYDVIPVGKVEDSNDSRMLYNVTNLSADSKYLLGLQVENSEGLRECPGVLVNASTSASSAAETDADSTAIVIPIIVVAIIVIAVVVVAVGAVLVFRRRRARSVPEATVDGTKKRKEKTDKKAEKASTANRSLEADGDVTYANTEVSAEEAKNVKKNKKKDTAVDMGVVTSDDGATYAQVVKPKRKNKAAKGAGVEENIYNNDNKVRAEVIYGNVNTRDQAQTEENVYSNSQSTGVNGGQAGAENNPGRKVNEEGLVYVMVEINKETTNPEIKGDKPKAPRKPEFEPVEYVSISHQLTEDQSGQPLS